MPCVITRPIKIILHADIAHLKAYHKVAKEIKTVNQTLHSTWRVSFIEISRIWCQTLQNVQQSSLLLYLNQMSLLLH